MQYIPLYWLRAREQTDQGYNSGHQEERKSRLYFMVMSIFDIWAIFEIL